jgi:hypothetical protein
MMTNDQILDDLNYASALAREGASAPLVGGRIGLMWGCLLSITLTLQWAILSQALALPVQSLFYVWFAFSAVGGIGSAVMGPRLDKLDGAQSISNRVEKYVWTTFATMMAILFAGVLLNVLFLSGDITHYNLLVIIAFAGQGFAYGVVAMMSKARWLFAASLGSFITASICIPVYDETVLFLIGGVACVFTIVIPSLISIKNEQHDDI